MAGPTNEDWCVGGGGRAMHGGAGQEDSCHDKSPHVNGGLLFEVKNCVLCSRMHILVVSK